MRAACRRRRRRVPAKDPEESTDKLPGSHERAGRSGQHIARRPGCAPMRTSRASVVWSTLSRPSFEGLVGLEACTSVSADRGGGQVVRRSGAPGRPRRSWRRSEHLRRATKAFLAGDQASARAVFEAILPPIACVDSTSASTRASRKCSESTREPVSRITPPACTPPRPFASAPTRYCARSNWLRVWGRFRLRSRTWRTSRQECCRISGVPSAVGKAPPTVPPVQGRVGN